MKFTNDAVSIMFQLYRWRDMKEVYVCDSVCTFEFEFQILNELSVRIRRWQALYWNYGGMGGVYYQN